MSDTVFLLLCFVKGFRISNANWTSPASTVTRSDESFAVGSYNNSIFLVGGWKYPRQIIEYRINTDVFIDIGETVLTNDTWGFGQFWSQKGEILYMIDGSGSMLSTFNVKNQQYRANWRNIDIAVGGTACLAILNHHLYVVGGWGYNIAESFDILQVMDLSTYEWMTNVSTMNTDRRNHACIVHDDYLWVFGGYNGSQKLHSNERINIINITANRWYYIDPLSVGTSAPRAAIWHHSIFIFGGESDSGILDTIHIVNTTTGKLTLSQDRLVYPVANPGVLITNNVIYVFGGRKRASSGISYQIDKWMQYSLIQSDTFAPTKYTSLSSTDLNELPTQIIQHNTTQYISYPSSDKSDDPSDTNTTQTLLILVIAGSIASFCVLCCCVLLIWKIVTQKHWNPEPHDTAGDDEIDDESEKEEEGELQSKKEGSMSVGNVMTIEGPDNAVNLIEDGEFIFKEGIDIQDVQQTRMSSR